MMKLEMKLVAVATFLLIICHIRSIESSLTRKENLPDESNRDLRPSASEESTSQQNDGVQISIDGLDLPEVGSKPKHRRRNKKDQTVSRRKNKKRGKSNRNRRPKKIKVPPSEEFDTEALLPEEDQKEILRNTMKYMFGFEHINENSDTKMDDFDVLDVDSVHNVNNDVFSPQNPQPHSRNMPRPPHFMLELYRTYSEDKSLMMLNAKSQGNTIRSFFPISADPSKRYSDQGKPVTISPVVTANESHVQVEREIPVFLFNLSSIPESEKLVGAEVRLDDIEQDDALNAEEVLRNNAQEMQDEFHSWNSEANNARTENGNLNTDRKLKKDGWFVIAAVYRLQEIFSIVGSSSKLSSSINAIWSDKDLFRKASIARKYDHVLVIRFEKENKYNRPNDDELSSKLSDTLRRGVRSTSAVNILPKSFFVVGYERPKRDSERNAILASSVPFRSTASSPTNGQGSYSNQENGGELELSLIPILIVYCNDTTNTPDSKEHASSSFLWSALGNVTSSITGRNRRSIDNNINSSENVTSVSPQDTNTSTFTRKTKKSKAGNKRGWYKKDKGRKLANKYDTDLTNEIENDQTELDSNGNSLLMKTLQDRNKLRQRGKKRKGKGRRKGQRNRDRSGKKKQFPENNLNRISENCGRHSLKVDFHELGWSEWVISPTAYEAYYCKGECRFPKINKGERKASNHALIQGLIRAIGINEEVPAPCCTPNKMGSLSVLYFDQAHNVVLKVYPDMSVESCSCR